MQKKGKKHDAISTFLGTDASIDGTIEFQGTIRLDGKVNGKIKSTKADTNNRLSHFITVRSVTILAFCHWYFCHSNLFRASCFGFRFLMTEVIVFAPFHDIPGDLPFCRRSVHLSYLYCFNSRSDRA